MWLTAVIYFIIRVAFDFSLTLLSHQESRHGKRSRMDRGVADPLREECVTRTEASQWGQGLHYSVCHAVRKVTLWRTWHVPRYSHNPSASWRACLKTLDYLFHFSKMLPCWIVLFLEGRRCCDRISLYSPGWPLTCDPHASASWVLGLQAWTTMILMPQPLGCWDYRREPPCLVYKLSDLSSANFNILRQRAGNRFPFHLWC
jgi:hypothetical protein